MISYLNNKTVAQKVIQLIKDIHSNLNEDLQHLIKEINYKFLSKCFDKLE